MNPIVQAIMAQAIAGLPVPPLIEPPKMEDTMQISEEMETYQREAFKGIAKEFEDLFKDEYYEHPKGGVNVTIDEVAYEEERKS